MEKNRHDFLICLFNRHDRNTTPICKITQFPKKNFWKNFVKIRVFIIMEKIVRITESDLTRIVRGVMSESRNKSILWFRRRMEDKNIMDYLKDIIDEGFDYVSYCDYKYNFQYYLYDVAFGSAQTFIQSYEELYKSKENMDEIERFIYNFIVDKFGKYIRMEFNDRADYEECDDK